MTDRLASRERVDAIALEASTTRLSNTRSLCGNPPTGLRHTCHVIERHRDWRPGRPVPLDSILGPLRRGAGDPTYAAGPGSVWRAVHTPEGPATVHFRTGPANGTVTISGYGPAADWVVDHGPTMLGADDDPLGFQPDHAALTRAWRRHSHWRVPRSGLVFEAIVAASLEQKVTGREAWDGWRRLVRRFGQPAPAPAGAPALMVMPPPSVVRSIASWDWLQMGIDGARSRVAVRAAVRADSLQRTLHVPVSEAEAALRSLPGVGRWTAAEVRQRAHGDADAVSFGDYHLASSVGHALTGESVDDAGMAALIECYRPHRYRVQRLVELAGIAAPRRGPRMSPRTHLPRPARR